MPRSDISFSFEFFPPKTEKMEQNLWETIDALKGYKPKFVSVTYGAGGSTRERTHNTVAKILKETDLIPAAHLTCVDASKSAVDEVIQAYWDLGVKHIVALRGDPKEGLEAPYQPHPEGYQKTADLVKGIKNIGNFEISVSAYPEVHPQSKNMAEDLAVLQQKVDEGATRAITQFFFKEGVFENLYNEIVKRNIKVELVPGITPITNLNQLNNFAKKCGTDIPQALLDEFNQLEDDKEAYQNKSLEFTTNQINSLIDLGIKHFHLYTMNKSELTKQLIETI